MSDCKAFICGCQGLVLTDEERAFLLRERPWGLILFRRNVDTPAQVSALVRVFRDLVGRADAPVLVDQEGGRVQRLGPPHWPRYPAAAFFHERFGATEEALQLAALSARLMAHDLATLGINVDCLPVLDVPAGAGHAVIGDRAYARDPQVVASFGRVVAEAFCASGVLPVIKHAPGHGRATADSHLELPRVHASRAELEASDFVPFRAIADLPLAMTAHVVYTALDPDRPATLSPAVVMGIIRDTLAFDGLLMTDDLSMKALSGSFTERTAAAFAAGVDIVLHCNGDLAEATPVAAVAPMLAGKSLARAHAALARIAGAPEPFDLVDARARLEMSLAPVA